MSLITLCPACGTTFKVVRDQLKISDGWVRCGRCAEVFDSTPSLREVELVPGELPSAEVPTPSPEADQPPGFATSVVPDIPLDALTPPDEVPEAVMVAAQNSGGAHTDLEVADDAQAFRPSQSLTASVDRMSSLLGDDVQQIAPAALVADKVSDKVSETASVPGGDFSFLAQARQQVADSATARRVRPLAQAGWGLLGLLLSLLLLTQGVVQERDRLAAARPQWRMALEGLCGLLSCQLNPWRQIESISVDASSFNKLRGDTYRLSFVLKNAADVAVAYPAMELTLTDSQDSPLMRRVLLPAELSPKSPVLEAGAEWSGSTLVALAGEAGGSALARRVAGYRILAFYP